MPGATLHVEHPISDFPTWKAAFDRFAAKRREMGVTAQRIHQPQGNAAYVLLQLDFPSVGQAQAFAAFLREQVWKRAEASPALAGTPRAEVLVPMEV
ncbi:MAG: hypothetical protein N2422_12025 [Rhodobacteraceae bacterium]|nr:hypothetical protein [Paracoccaceae bacterium]